MNTSLSRILPALALALTLSSGFAQETVPVDDARTRGQEFIASVDGANEALFGTLRFGIYFNGQVNIGTIVADVAESAEAGAAYRIKTKLQVAMGPRKQTVSDESHLDATGGMVSTRSTEVETIGETESETIKHVSLVDGKWTEVRDEDGEETTTEIESKGTWHSHIPSMVLLGHILPDVEETTVLELDALNFMEGRESFGYKPMTVEIQPFADYEHRGETVKAKGIFFDHPDDGEDTRMMVDTEGKVLAIWPDVAPIRMIAGTEEEILEDIAPPAAEGEGETSAAGSPTEAVMTYLRVLGKISPVTELDGVMDWEAIREEMMADSPEVEALSAEMIGQLLKSQFEKAPPAFGEEELNLVGAMLGSEVDGETAKVSIPGQEDDPFLLRLVEGKWIITHFPH